MPTQLENETAAALRASKAINEGQHTLTEESRLLLVAMLRTEMREAVAEGISDAMTDEAAERLFNKFFEVMSKQATQKTGTFVLGGVGALMRRLGWAVLFIAAVYALGGWGAVTTGIKALKAGSS